MREHEREKTDRERIGDLEGWVALRGDPMHQKVEGLVAWQKWLIGIGTGVGIGIGLTLAEFKNGLGALAKTLTGGS